MPRMPTGGARRPGARVRRALLRALLATVPGGRRPLPRVPLRRTAGGAGLRQPQADLGPADRLPQGLWPGGWSSSFREEVV